MMNKTEEISTQELWAKLFQAPTLAHFLAEGKGNYELPSFSDYITDLCRVRGVKHETIIKKSDLEPSYGHRLFSGKRNPSRDTVLQMAYGFEMNLDEVQQLLKIAHVAMLHPKVKRDAVIAYCISRNKTLVETQITLENHLLPLIGGVRHGK